MWGRIWREDETWWGPYLGVLLFAALAVLAVPGFVVVNLPEIVRILRTSGAL